MMQARLTHDDPGRGAVTHDSGDLRVSLSQLERAVRVTLDGVGGMYTLTLEERDADALATALRREVSAVTIDGSDIGFFAREALLWATRPSEADHNLKLAAARVAQTPAYAQAIGYRSGDLRTLREKAADAAEAVRVNDAALDPQWGDA